MVFKQLFDGWVVVLFSVYVEELIGLDVWVIVDYFECFLVMIVIEVVWQLCKI